MNAPWDPIPAIPRQLADVIARARLGSGDPLAVAARFGGPWGVCIHWPAGFSPSSPIRTGQQRQSSRGLLAAVWDLLARLVQWILGSRRPVERASAAPGGAPDPNTADQARHALIAALCDAHARLQTQNLAFLTRQLAPFRKQVPPRLSTVTSKGLLWALMVRTGRLPGTYRIPPEDYRLDERCTAGDMLSLHFQAEQAVVAVARQSGLRPPPGHKARVVGGLRTREFLSAWSALAASTRWDVALARENLLRILQASPLTSLIYADVLGAPGEPIALGPLCGIAAASCPDQDGDPDGLAMWLSQLARSMLAVLLSPPPAWEQLVAVQQRIGRLVEQLRFGPLRRDRQIELNKLRGIEGRLRRELLEQNVRKVVFLGRSLQAVSDSKHAGCRALHYRLLDMLARHFIAASMPDMSADWQKARQSDKFPIPSMVLADRNSSSFRRFVRVLFGVEGDNLQQLQDRLRQRTWSQVERDAVRWLLASPPIVNDRDPSADAGPDGATPQQVADQLGVPVQWVRQLRGRFEGPDRGVWLCYGGTAERGDAPAVIVASWLSDLSNLVPEETATSQEVSQ